MSNKTYVSLFSSSGVGCYGLKMAGFECVATNELIERRMAVQKANNKCKYPTGYILGDISEDDIKQKIFNEIDKWKLEEKIDSIDILVATPPCQGISLANHKKNNEIVRNSLVVESIKITKKLLPKIFIFENVNRFLKTLCTDIDKVDKPIQEAINLNLGEDYNIYSDVINFKNYGSNSSRTRTLVIGVRKDYEDIVTPNELFPDLQKEVTLREVIGDMPRLSEMGEIDPKDIYHSFRKYDPRMRDWIRYIKEGQSAFDNTDKKLIPHQIKNGVIVPNQNKNGDKYTRQYWDKVAPCIHTRNDILASQNTVHPVDDRVFSIRELMKLMTIPDTFNWSDIPFEVLNDLSIEEKQAYLKKHEINIRQSIGEAVPTAIFYQIANKANNLLFNRKRINNTQIKATIETFNLIEHVNLVNFIKENPLNLDIQTLSRIAELSNTKRLENAAYYTDKSNVFEISNNLPSFSDKKELRILEPAAGIGNFLPMLFNKYSHISKVIIDVFDINQDSIEIMKVLLSKGKIPHNFQINYYNADFLTYELEQVYDLVIGNPPYGKVADKKLSVTYKSIFSSQNNSSNIFTYFLEKSLSIANYTCLIMPKAVINSPEYGYSRELMKKYRIASIIDFGEKGFKGVKIETVAISIDKLGKIGKVKVVSKILNNEEEKLQTYITDPFFPTWLIYRNESFDSIVNKLNLGVFDTFRDRQITNKILSDKGDIRVLKSRNIGNGVILDIEGYDSYINNDSLSQLQVSKFINTPNKILVPNLTYYPRACFLPSNTIVNGSVAILIPKNGVREIKIDDLEYFASDEFTYYYKIARNYGTRSLNIDRNSVFYFGLKKENVLNDSILMECKVKGIKTYKLSLFGKEIG